MGGVIPHTGEDISSERGGLLHSYSCDIHMNSLPNVWHLSSSQQSYTSFDPCLSSYQLASPSPTHLFILQHGFQGTGFDMRLIRNALHMEFPDALVMTALLSLPPPILPPPTL
jgi:hypothetical protein